MQETLATKCHIDFLPGELLTGPAPATPGANAAFGSTPPRTTSSASSLTVVGGAHQRLRYDGTSRAVHTCAL
eukprot:1233713-Amphidinium_carterae.1